jgi:hypothetical protein
VSPEKNKLVTTLVEETVSPKLSRRDFLKLSGATVLVLAGGTLWRATDQGVFSVGQGPAYTPWLDWKNAEGGPLAIVRAAILAANPHNTQPWIFHVSDSQIDLFANSARNLGTVDPYRREMRIGLGCALENLMLAACALGWNPELTLAPDPADEAHVARVVLSPGTPSVSEFYQAIPRRHTNRAPYAAQPISADVFAAMNALNNQPENINLFWLKEESALEKFSVLNIRATEAFIADPQQSADSGRWFHQDWQELQEKRDGLTLDAQGGSPLITAMGKMLPPLSQADNDAYWLKALRASLETAAAFGLIAIPDRRSLSGLLEAGQLYQRLNLWAVTAELAMQPLNQIVERIDREFSLGQASQFDSDLHALGTISGWQIVMPFRIGYPTVEALPAPRRSAEMVSIYS